MSNLFKQLKIAPIVQAPMAGVSTVELASAVCEAGALGSISIGAVDAEAGREMIRSLKAKTERPFNVNVFCHRSPRRDKAREDQWLEQLGPVFARFDATPPSRLEEIYTSFRDDDAALEVVLEERPRVVSFHFGLPQPDKIAALKAAGVLLLATATQLEEAYAVADAGVDVIVAQGYEAGGHRGVFDPAGEDSQLSALTLARIIVRNCRLPVIAAGGIMDGAGVAAALSMGAIGAQLGTAFVACPESSAKPAHRERLGRPNCARTCMTSAISGRPARCLQNSFTELGATLSDRVHPDYPLAYDAGKALATAAAKKGDATFGAQWAGQGAPRARAMPARELVATLQAELRQTIARPQVGE